MQRIASNLFLEKRFLQNHELEENNSEFHPKGFLNNQSDPLCNPQTRQNEPSQAMENTIAQNSTQYRPNPFLYGQTV
jgi:hypothetical protein